MTKREERKSQKKRKQTERRWTGGGVLAIWNRRRGDR
jgi:hypothetical protein